MMKHVPGPWKVYQERPHYYSIGTDYAKDRGRDQNIVRDVKRESNARVMAAAPELLAVLKKLVTQLHNTCVSDMDSGDACCVAVDEAKRIIAKAEGRSVMNHCELEQEAAVRSRNNRNHASERR